MMSSTAWACRVLSPATLHSVCGTARCHCITRPVAVADKWPTTLVPSYSCTVPRVIEPLSTVANHCDLPTTRLVGI
jgi:hypothetical protein